MSPLPSTSQSDSSLSIVPPTTEGNIEQSIEQLIRSTQKALAVDLAQDLLKADRPRIKLLEKGPDALTDSELLSIIIGSGSSEKNALYLAWDILEECNSELPTLAKKSIHQLMKVKGISISKATKIIASMELGRRRQSAHHSRTIALTHSRDTAGYLGPLLRDYAYEIFGVLYLRPSGNVIKFEIVSKGGANSTIADPRIVFKNALELEASSLILCHNHPSGSFRPSKADLELTTKLAACGKLLDIKIVDHIIISEGGYFSFADEGLI